jgi:hypothetical protein
MPTRRSSTTAIEELGLSIAEWSSTDIPSSWKSLYRGRAWKSSQINYCSYAIIIFDLRS